MRNHCEGGALALLRRGRDNPHTRGAHTHVHQVSQRGHSQTYSDEQRGKNEGVTSPNHCVCSTAGHSAFLMTGWLGWMAREEVGESGI